MKKKVLKFSVSFLWMLSVVFTCNTLVAQNNTTPLIDSILVKKHLYTLASDEMKGRKVGTEGIEKAAQYIENEFSKLELNTFEGAADYRQRFKKKGIKLFNIIGVLEGTTKKEEYVVISAHYDHLGILKAVNGDAIANGADDDASGVTAVLSLAKYWKERSDNERTIIFIAFTAEEKGLWGSNYFGKKVNPKKYVAGINIEMIGKESKFGPKSAFLTGFDKSTFGKIIQQNLKNTDFKLYPDPYTKFRLFYRSDNASLARLGIPAHTFSTDPIDTDKYYHTVDDEVETLNIGTITNTIRAISIGTESIIKGIDTPSRVVD
ncbi:M20/M25/M40 family metallo-hydrolase [Wenyingzhuangia marina]|uniref:Peptidase family M28 n=1 Tax=Wenyingzhuangia marina TaxID=1195760 RepID=A0A1M5TBP4_9FLAO|nr:M20/M25/M40 family metallo-hydrolase [Wenyingzhuangia marina]GGF66035.1 peptidase M28 [Wenyingzhuangia marina]SHH47763.1 Peptidase family M28 [Wenyingzhuangia marina]